MMPEIILRPQMLPYLLYQRTQYASAANRRAKQVLRPLRLYWLWRKFVEARVEAANRSVATRMYGDELAREFAEIEAFLPTSPPTVLDIGCGLGGIDVLLNRHYEGKASLHLLDKDGISDIYYGFKDTGAFYNSAALTLQFLQDNGANATFHDAKDGFPSGKFDLIVSLISWGFHYPVSTYLDAAYDALAPGGVLIIDVRDGTDGESQLRSRFRRLEVITRDAKRARLALSN